MQTVKFLRHEYVVTDGVGLPLRAVHLEVLSSDQLLTLHNLLALNLERRFGGRVRRFKSKKEAFRRIREKLRHWEGFDPEDDI